MWEREQVWALEPIVCGSAGLICGVSENSTWPGDQLALYSLSLTFQNFLCPLLPSPLLPSFNKHHHLGSELLQLPRNCLIQSRNVYRTPANARQSSGPGDQQWTKHTKIPASKSWYFSKETDNKQMNMQIIWCVITLENGKYSGDK